MEIYGIKVTDIDRRLFKNTPSVKMISKVPLPWSIILNPKEYLSVEERATAAHGLPLHCHQRNGNNVP